MHLSAKLRQPFLFWPLVIAILLGGWATVTRLVPAVSRWLGIATESRVHIEHLVGAAAMVPIAYAGWAICFWSDLWLNGDLVESKAREFARWSAWSICAGHLVIELAIQPLTRRDHVQWDHVATDTISALLGYWLCILFLKKQIPAGRAYQSARLKK